MNNPLNYDESLQRIEEILNILEEGQKGMEELTVLVKEATELISSCKSKLKNINEEVTKSFN
jgi:exodeoxyribonuclease VII small subunit